jgi:3-oxoacyl-[acyl-carrier protein] reductase
MDLGLKGRRALVMGGSRGLGKAVAEVLAGEGARVAICARDAGRVAATAAEIGVEGLVCDLSIPGAADSLVRKAQSLFGHLDVLVVNTGGPPSGQFADLSDHAWHAA